MAASVLSIFLFLYLQNVCLSQDVSGPPTIDGSYIAKGELVTRLPDGDKVQANFDETYDSKSGNAAFLVREMGINATFVELALTQQTFKYSNKECQLVTAEEWVEVPAPPSLIGYKGDKNRIQFSLKQLFNISNSYLEKQYAGEKTTFRGIPAVSWLYTIPSVETSVNRTMVNVYAYWSDESWTTTSKSGQQMPLGYKITKLVHDANRKLIGEAEQFINVFGFVEDAVNQELFEPRQGIICPGRKELFSFPKLTTAKTLSLRSEIILPDYSEIKTTDIWLDAVSGMLRVDLDLLDSQNPRSKSRRFTTQITSKKLGKIFALDVFEGTFTCKAYDIDKFTMDYQELFNPKLDLKLWSFDYLLGRNTTTYVHIGKTSKRNIPCHLFQGERKDWPNKDSGVTSIWEWCVAENIGSENEATLFRDSEVALINAQVLITDSKDAGMKGFRMIYHFYDVVEEDPKALGLGTFDISRCFKPNQRRALQFTVDIAVTDDNIDAVQNATSDVGFLSLWKSAISDKSGLSLETLRVANVKSTVMNRILIVFLTLLDIHPDIRSGSNQKSLDSAFSSLQSAVNNNDLQIKYSFTKKEITTLKAVKDSLEDVVGTPIDISTLPPPPPTKSTSSPRTLMTFDLKTPDTSGNTDDGSVTTQLPITKKEVVLTGHSPGTAAGVAIAMLIIGFTLGAGGTFYKVRIASR